MSDLTPLNRRRLLVGLAETVVKVFHHDDATVCTRHLRFVPCRRCPSSDQQWHSQDPVHVAIVHLFQNSKIDAVHAYDQLLASGLDMNVVITCPRCERESRNPIDIEQGWCAACQWWTSDEVGWP